MSTLGRWLADILNAHIERHNVPVEVEYTLPPVPQELLDPFDRKALLDAMARADENRLIAAMIQPPAAVRPCWACGDPGGFHAFHLPCSKVAPFRLKSAEPPAALRPDFVDGVRILWDLEPGATT